jgi:hypothetical protein
MNRKTLGGHIQRVEDQRRLRRFEEAPMSLRSANTTVGAVAGFVMASVVAAGPAAAQEPSLVNVLLCSFPVAEGGGGGETTVAAGPVHAQVMSWGTGPRGALVHWLKSQETTVTVQYGDEPATTMDLSDAFTAPAQLEGEKVWFSGLVLPLGDLAAGDTVLVSFETTWTKPTIDFFFGPDSDPQVIRGDTLSASCLITAE